MPGGVTATEYLEAMDRLSFLVGRAVLEWGELDQYLWSRLRMLEIQRWGEAGRDGDPLVKPNRTLEREDRFIQRVKMLRRGYVNRVGEGSKAIRMFDVWYGKMRPAERMRAHLAHATLRMYEAYIVEAYDEREEQEKLRRAYAGDRIDWDAFHSTFDKVKYTFDDIEQLTPTIRALKSELAEIDMLACDPREKLGNIT